MIDWRVSGVAVVATLLWAATVLLVVTAWGLWLVGHPSAGFMVGLTAGVTSAGAATVQIRCFALNVCNLMRRLH